ATTFAPRPVKSPGCSCLIRAAIPSSSVRARSMRTPALPRHHIKAMITAHLPEVRIENPADGQPNLVCGCGIRKARRHDADDLVNVAIQTDLRAEHPSVACKTPLPKPVADHHNACGFRPVVLFPKRPTDGGLDTQREKEAGIANRPDQLLR